MRLRSPLIIFSSFFNMLRTELAFYVGCLNLHQQLAEKGEPMSFPLPVASANADFRLREYTMSVSLYA